MIRRLKSDARHLASVYKWLQFLVLLAGALATLFAAFKLKEIVPISVAIA